MLDWFTGSSRPFDEQCIMADDGASYVEEPPETPAHLFAFRAFQTAIFGTPHPNQDTVLSKIEPTVQSSASSNKALPSSRDSGSIGLAPVPRISEPSATEKGNAFVSPAKGILLTPGTGTTRRKTVSFGKLEAKARKEAKAIPCALERLDERQEKDFAQSDQSPQRPQPSLTKTLIELSKQKPTTEKYERRQDLQTLLEKNTREDGEQKKPVPPSPVEHTIDLSQPRSRSGQHWKAEYERYQRRSNQEMKRILKYGQNVKSFAVKKDSEATTLNEKLKRELAKVEAMEAKISKLASRLHLAHDQGPDNESDQMRLISELAQQTALAVRYKQKVDRYRDALQRQSSASGMEEAAYESQGLPESHEHGLHDIEDPAALATLRKEVNRLRDITRKAEEGRAKLETENYTLKRSLARVKEEMMSYESRRQTREDRLKKREEKHKAAREEAEEQLAKLMAEHQKLLRASQDRARDKTLQPETDFENEQAILQPAAYNKEHTKSALPDPSSTTQPHTSQLSPRRRRLPKPAIDIWTINDSPQDAPPTTNHPPNDESPTLLAPSSVKTSINRTLKEINQNLQSPPQPQSQAADQPSNPTFPKLTITTNAPPPPSSPSSEIPAPPQYLSSHAPARSSSLHTHIHARSRTSTLNSTRTSPLTAERAAAAKVRLARRSAEKRRGGSAGMGGGV